ncbi:MAG TPA: tetratricopeptide repeat protein [Cyclobacteriaceae bacterium]|nr:tetratricopeptide repeat protein [Cyclobacteriaceae bacterium]
MKPGADADTGVRKGRPWFLVFGLSLLALAIFWSVDPSFVYFTLSIAVFSLFKILQLKALTREDSANSNQGSFERSYESYKPTAAWLFWQDIKEIFRKDSRGPQSPQQARVLVMLVAGFIGAIFMIIILASLFSSNDVEDSMAYYQQATDYYNNQQYDSAAYYYKLAQIGDPENAELYFERGNAFLNGNKMDSALVMYDQALTIDPQHYRSQYNKGIVYFNQKNYRQAIDEARKVIAYNPDYNDAMLLVGDCFYNQSQLDSAVQWYEGAYANGYRSAILCHLMAYIYDTKGDTNRAIKLYREAISQDSTIADIYVRLGELVAGEEGNRYRRKAAELKQP